MVMTLINDEIFIVSASEFRSLQPIPTTIEDHLFSAELHLVHYVVARRVLGSTLYEQVVAALTFPNGGNDDFEALNQFLKPCLAAWAYFYALPNIYAELVDPPQDLGLMRIQQRSAAVAWTQELVQHLLDNPTLYPHYEVLNSARTYLGSPKLF